MFMEKSSVLKWSKFFGVLVVGTMFWACSDGEKTAGGSTEDAGIIAIKDLDVAGVVQKGPFVKGSAVTVRGIDCKTLELTDEYFESEIRSDKGDYDVDGISLSSTCAVFEVAGYFLNEVTGRTSLDKVTLRALTSLKDRKKVNVNLFTTLEYERVMKLAADKGKSFAEAKKQAEKEVLGAFDIKDIVSEFETLDIFEKGEGNAALLAASVLVLVQDSSSQDASVSDRVSRLAAAIAESGIWNDGLKAQIAGLASAALENGQMDSIRKNLESLDYANEVPQFEKYVTNFVDNASAMDDSTEYIDWSIPKEAHFNPNINYDSIVDSRDGKVYRTVKIGSQVWMAENLNYADSVATPSLLKKSWCFYDNPEHCEVAGRLYTWAAIVDSVNLANDEDAQFCGYLTNCEFPEKLRGICPEGWHLPDTTEWRTLVSTVADDPSVAGFALSSKVGWDKTGTGTDDYGFSAFPVGDKYRDFDFSEFAGTGLSGTTSFWSISEDSRDKQLAFTLGFFLGSVGITGDFKDLGLPLRCLKD